MKFQKDNSDSTAVISPPKAEEEEEKKIFHGRNPEIIKRIKEDRKIIDRAIAGTGALKQISPFNKDWRDKFENMYTKHWKISPIKRRALSRTKTNYVITWN